MVRPTDQEVTAIEKIVYHAHGSQEKEAWPHHRGKGHPGGRETREQL